MKKFKINYKAPKYISGLKFIILYLTLMLSNSIFAQNQNPFAGSKRITIRKETA